MDDRKVRENRARRMAARQGLQLVKSRARDPMSLSYGAYWLIDPNANTIKAGDPHRGTTLEAAEAWLRGER